MAPGIGNQANREIYNRQKRDEGERPAEGQRKPENSGNLPDKFEKDYTQSETVRDRRTSQEDQSTLDGEMVQ